MSSAKVWTDRRGRSVSAVYLRHFGNEVVLRKPSGEVFKVPIQSLSDADQAYLQAKLEAKGFRSWVSVDGKQMKGQYLRVRDGQVYLKINDAPINIPFERFSRADRDFIRGQAEEDGLTDQLPETEPEPELPPERLWTDTNGNSVSGQFDRILPDGQVLVVVDGETVTSDVKKLSPEDQDHLRALLEPEGLAHLVPEKRVELPKPEPKPEPNSEPKTEPVVDPVAPPKPPVEPMPELEPNDPLRELPRSTVEEEIPVSRPRPVPKDTSRGRNTDTDESRGRQSERSRKPALERSGDFDLFTFGSAIWLVRFGAFLGFLGHVWASAVAFQRGQMGWGFAALFCCPFDLVYAFMIKDENSGPLWLMLFSFVLQMIAMGIAVATAAAG